MQKCSVLVVRRCLVAGLLMSLLFISSYANAKEYLGLNLGEEGKKVHAKLKSSSASFNMGYGYKGQRVLSMTKINVYQRFSKYGRLKKGWLYFSPEYKLYRISVIWRDAGDTYKMLKDALDSKYGHANKMGGGFRSTYHYRDGMVSIKLTRNTFGFGDEQTTSLEYIYTPVLQEVSRARRAIEKRIKQNNAKKAAGDL